jgi:hypothetical protein
MVRDRIEVSVSRVGNTHFPDFVENDVPTKFDLPGRIALSDGSCNRVGIEN